MNLDQECVKPDQCLLTDEERERFINRAHSVFSWVGNLIPDKEKFDNTEIELRNVIFKLRTKKGITDDDRELARLLMQKIKVRKNELETRLKNDKMTLTAAKKLLDEISGLVKALNDLHDVELSDELIERKSAMFNRIDDEKRWQKYLKRIKTGEYYG
jgi:phosphoenolpyruvate synthase/pyruvate phosphate dikinase